MLEDSSTIDAVATREDGSVRLVIMDAGITEDPEERLGFLMDKLKCYLYYLCAGDFKKDHPGQTAGDADILVMCRVPPTKKMAEISAIQNPENADEPISISFEHFPGLD